ncbi:MAG: hypothetical protein RIF46_16985 [Cyclobacteriaceae bacterium]
MIEDKYVDKVIYVIEGSTIKKKELKDDLVDHFCCLIEMDMNRGLNFEEAFSRAQEQTAPNGLDEIQQETIFLLNYNRILFMKRFTYISGFLASFSLAVGFLFKILHLPGADQLTMIGIIGLAFIFLPLILADRFKHLGNQATIEKIKWIFGGLSALVFAIGGLFKILHWPGAGLLLGLSFLLFCVGFLPLLFFRMYKKSVEEL